MPEVYTAHFCLLQHVSRAVKSKECKDHLIVYYLFGSFISGRSDSVAVAFDSIVTSSVIGAVGPTSPRPAVPLRSRAAAFDFKVTTGTPFARGSATSLSASPSVIKRHF